MLGQKMTQPADDCLQVRIVTVDHYMCKPVRGLDELHSEFNGRETSRVPVIRIFGVKEDGEEKKEFGQSSNNF